MSEVVEKYRSDLGKIKEKYMDGIKEAISECNAIGLATNYGNLAEDVGVLKQNIIHAWGGSEPGEERKGLDELLDDARSLYMAAFREVLKFDDFDSGCSCKKWKEEVK